MPCSESPEVSHLFPSFSHRLLPSLTLGQTHWCFSSSDTPSSFPPPGLCFVSLCSTWNIVATDLCTACSLILLGHPFSYHQFQPLLYSLPPSLYSLAWSAFHSMSHPLMLCSFTVIYYYHWQVSPRKQGFWLLGLLLMSPAPTIVPGAYKLHSKVFAVEMTMTPTLADGRKLGLKLHLCLLFCILNKSVSSFMEGKISTTSIVID